LGMEDPWLSNWPSTFGRGGQMQRFNRGGDLMDRTFVDFEKMLREPVHMDVQENDREYVLSVRHPGLKKNDLKLDLNNGVLTISGERAKETSKTNESKDQEFYSYSSKSFSRSMTLPEHIDINKIQAKHENGMLKISLPKLPSAQMTRKQINIE